MYYLHIFLSSLIYDTQPENANAEARKQYGYAWNDLKSNILIC